MCLHSPFNKVSLYIKNDGCKGSNFLDINEYYISYITFPFLQSFNSFFSEFPNKYS